MCVFFLSSAVNFLEFKGTVLQYCTDHGFWCQIGLQYMFAGGIASFNVNNLAPILVCIPSEGVESFPILQSPSVLNCIFTCVNT